MTSFQVYSVSFGRVHQKKLSLLFGKLLTLCRLSVNMAVHKCHVGTTWGNVNFSVGAAQTKKTRTHIEIVNGVTCCPRISTKTRPTTWYPHFSLMRNTRMAIYSWVRMQNRSETPSEASLILPAQCQSHESIRRRMICTTEGGWR